jgi:hypothetical protein
LNIWFTRCGHYDDLQENLGGHIGTMGGEISPKQKSEATQVTEVEML